MPDGEKFERARKARMENGPLHNFMQVELVKRWAVKLGLPKDDKKALNKAATDWTEEHHFSQTFSDLLFEHPEYYDEYKNNPEETLLKIEKALYGEEELKEAA